ncbi:glutathione S-transferase C-terminal domain-containing protein [Streptococcus sp. HF-1907]|uniref:glutathione S-transferase C-terminal domain-containing protein n=1 Tax=Streptococcus sp. HF-1907 TaxID=2785793 RepID=UPI00189DEF23|nr:glutathione S-transferase C-terminal domain-containing protein [Streptococcus sp. HF-1907]MBF7094127.1 glutathione S-transferase C-terminal domain-containing protein [Streptococcus sp. HF-1907]
MSTKEIKPVTLKIRPVETKTEIDERGAFQRQPNHFTRPFGDDEGELKAAAGKYRLFWARGCHWSNRASIVRELLGLEDVISVNQVGHTEDPERRKYGWEFAYEPDGKDPVTGAEYLAEFYYRADPDYTGRTTVPALVDLDTYEVVNNDYHRLTNYFETAFKPFQKEDAPELYPEELRQDIDNFYDHFLFPFVNNGTYRMMFAQSLVAYNEAFEDFYNALDVIEAKLETNRFLFGDYVTDSDVRLFVTLARFDTHYYRNLGPLKKRISEYKNIWGYCRDLYEIPAFRNNTYFHDIARGWDTKKEKLFVDFNSRFADDIDFEGIWSQPHTRHYLSKTPNQKFLIRK